MSKSGQHIDWFEELIRISELVGNRDIHLFEQEMNKAANAIDNKTRNKIINNWLRKYRKGSIFKRWGIFIITAVFIGVTFLVLNKEYKTKENMGQQNTILSTQSHSLGETHTKYRLEKVAPLITPLPVDTIADFPLKSLKSVRDNPPEKEYSEVTNIVVKEKVETSSNKGIVCRLPQSFVFEFEDKTHRIYDSDSTHLNKLVNQVQQCSNIKEITITAYYQTNFLFFTNRDLASTRAYEIRKHLRRNKVSTDKLKKVKTNILKHTKELSNKSENSVYVQLE